MTRAQREPRPGLRCPLAVEVLVAFSERARALREGPWGRTPPPCSDQGTQAVCTGWGCGECGDRTLLPAAQQPPPGWEAPGVFTLTLALCPCPEGTLSQRPQCNGTARACGLEGPQCLFHKGFYSLKSREVLAGGVTAEVSATVHPSILFLIPAWGPGHEEDRPPCRTGQEPGAFLSLRAPGLETALQACRCAGSKQKSPH